MGSRAESQKGDSLGWSATRVAPGKSSKTNPDFWKGERRCRLSVVPRGNHSRTIIFFPPVTQQVCHQARRCPWEPTPHPCCSREGAREEHGWGGEIFFGAATQGGDAARLALGYHLSPRWGCLSRRTGAFIGKDVNDNRVAGHRPASSGRWHTTVWNGSAWRRRRCQGIVQEGR
jgi:hypothetical protein